MSADELEDDQVELPDDEMIEAFKDAAGDKGKVILGDGRLVSRPNRNVLIDGKPTTWLEPDERAAVLQELRRAGNATYLDPAKNPFIKLEPD